MSQLDRTVRQCTACGKTKQLRCFGLRPGNYRKSSCKICLRNKQRKYSKENQDKIEEYKMQNMDLIRQRKHKWQAANPTYNKEYYEVNKTRVNKQKTQYSNNRKKIDIEYRIRCNLRSRLYHALKGQAKNGSAVRDMGCTVEELKIYLESKFKEGMSWDNYGQWHIDHILPLVKFNLVDRDELLKACHYTNLQPLWAKENILKKDMVHSA